MTGYSLANIIDYLQECDKDSDTCDAVYALKHGNVSQFVEIKLEKFLLSVGLPLQILLLVC